jgi:hypothetical protein
MAAKSKVAIEPKDFIARLRPEDRKEVEADGELNLWRFEPISWAARIVVGWCLYRQKLMSTDITWKKRAWKEHQLGKRGVTGVITHVDHICTILNSGRWDPLAHGLDKDFNKIASGFFKRPHWRGRHMRRPPGSPRGAQQTILVHPHLIREDLVPYFGIIGGTNIEVLPEE